jgi:hypothetical protein
VCAFWPVCHLFEAPDKAYLKSFKSESKGEARTWLHVMSPWGQVPLVCAKFASLAVGLSFCDTGSKDSLAVGLGCCDTGFKHSLGNSVLHLVHWTLSI